ncbi:hypothetical protein E5Z56_00690 [Ruminococcus bovis]|uniref:HPP family protein n=2 Tax=Oscillospiraceae TaxID=216572 RepID=A0A4P8XSS5_9FIRM|nr:hypothetical protein E5Z56_00690 [Ruminococcus bovis]
MKQFIKNAIPYISTLLLVGLMVGIAELLNEKEIIFPEITALAVGYMVAQKRSWKVNGKRMLLLITICATVGVLIVRYSGLTLFPQMIIAFSFAQILFMFSGTTFAPFVSAIVLPVMMQTKSFIYPISAVVLTILVIGFHQLFLKMEIRQDEEYIPVMLNSKDDIIDTALRIVCVAIVGFVAIYFDFKFVIAPPLLVAFTEFSRPRNKVRNKPIKTVLVITGCALVGSLSRYLFTIKLDLPLTVSALIATLIMLLILTYTKMYMPPVGAITILSMIIPQSSVITYPLQIFVGSVVIILLSRVFFMWRQDKKIYENDYELTAH